MRRRARMGDGWWWVGRHGGGRGQGLEGVQLFSARPRNGCYSMICRWPVCSSGGWFRIPQHRPITALRVPPREPSSCCPTPSSARRPIASMPLAAESHLQTGSGPGLVRYLSAPSLAARQSSPSWSPMPRGPCPCCQASTPPSRNPWLVKIHLLTLLVLQGLPSVSFQLRMESKRKILLPRRLAEGPA